MPELSLNPTFIILGLAFLFFILLLYLREYNLRKKLETDSDKFLRQIKEKGWETLHKSIQKSQDILGEAELEGVKVVADTKFETKKMEQQYALEITQTLEQSRQAITKSQAALIQFMQDLQKGAQEFEAASQSTIQQRTNELFERLEQKLSDFLVSAEQKTTSSIELELKSTRELIETYRNQQFKLIDENIIAMMEQTLNIVLAKKLSLKDQLDLIYEALEKAKIEKFVV